MQPVITTSRNKGKGPAFHKKTSSNVSLPSDPERGRGAKSNPKSRSHSAAPTAPITQAPRPLVLNEATRANVADSPPMSAGSDLSDSSTDKLVRGPKRSEPPKPLITLISEARGGTFYCGTGAVQRAIAKTKAYSEGLLRDVTNQSKPAEGQEDSADYFLLTDVIGTEWLITCVGLFFVIGKDRLFFAHIFAGYGDMPKSGLDRKARDEVSSAILKRLEHMSEKQGWTPQDVVVESLIIANGLKADLRYPVRDAVARFLGYKDPEVLKPHVRRFGGFAVNRNGQFIKPYDSDEQIGDYSVSGHSKGLLPNLWRYSIGKGWLVKMWPSEGAE